MSLIRCLFLAGLLSLGGLAAQAQTYSVSWYTIDGGGGTSSGGAYTLSGTIGQPDAGVMTGDTYALVGGFWSVIAAIQTPGAPHLTIARADPNVIVSWPASASGFVLEQNSALKVTPWTQVQAQVTLVGNTNQVTLPVEIGNKFYRLRQE